MSKSFLYQFKTSIKVLSENTDDFGEIYYNPELQVNLDETGDIAWSSPARKPYTTCNTVGVWIKAGYTKSNKWKSGRYRPSKTDRRSGK